MTAQAARTLFVTALLLGVAPARGESPAAYNRLFERTFQSQKTYADPFNDVDVDVVFTGAGKSWRVPTFWRGGNRWTVRFAPPAPGEYEYRLESTDSANPDLNGHQDHVNISAYSGTNALLRHGMPQVGPDGRHFAYADGAPFYWLGDTWWTGMSDRLSWDTFQKAADDRQQKGFTVVQIVAGLVPSNEEQAPIDAGFRNEGGPVWDPQWKQVNPAFFDQADRRVLRLIDSGLVPAIVGGWHQVLPQMGAAKLKKHWRYIIARWGAYPVFWIAGGEVFDPPLEQARKLTFIPKMTGWTDVVRYVKATDPYHHPLSVHEIPPPYDTSVEDESLLDFDFFQASHFGWPSIALEVALLDMHRARTAVKKPEVEGEIGYEELGGTNGEDFQRASFWLAMLNGAAGYTYGANALFESYSVDKPFHRTKYSFLTSEEGMHLPGSRQVGLGAKLLEQYSWWQLEPHPEWVMPRGTTLLAPRAGLNGFDLGDFRSALAGQSAKDFADQYPGGEWKARHGNIFLPYAAGIPGKLRLIYVPCFGLFCSSPPTILGLEAGVRYQAYFWEPSLGVKVHLGAVERPAPGALLSVEGFESASGHLTLARQVNQADLVAAADGHATGLSLILRYHDAGNYLAAAYSSKSRTISLLDRKQGIDGPALAITPVPVIRPDFHLTAEARGSWLIVSITDGQHTYTSEIAHVGNVTAGRVGYQQGATHFELRRSPTLVTDQHVERQLYDASGGYRGELQGSGWDDLVKEKIILLDAYRPLRLPMPQDWLLVLENRTEGE